MNRLDPEVRDAILRFLRSKALSGDERALDALLEIARADGVRHVVARIAPDVQALGEAFRGRGLQ